ncbi:hypothetical protein D081_1416 [Anaerovibrio sp. JC8]|uniref:DUF3793 family protein n=1 Tax=Anaerovibrio sp. JC8 TaxID=1240085 RepID=UPI000A0D7DE7|nr:DUF3793 family protein [Anaerovibrio sp. JC8]ORT99835.1 hypothetical protein D081_1416 [Anaerovibrio sp. JC8]
MNKNNLYDNYEHQMAYHCAPTIKGIKCGSMVAFKINSDDSFQDFMQKHHTCFKCHGIKYLMLSRQKRHALMLFYRPKLLTRLLRRPLAIDILKSFGYPVEKGISEESLPVLLDRLKKRIAECDGFPHEIGIFLGYPPADVQGFIKNKGQNYLYSGFWKVYSNEAAQKHLFECYNNCINNMCARLKSGESLQDLISAA